MNRLLCQILYKKGEGHELKSITYKSNLEFLGKISKRINQMDFFCFIKEKL